MMHQKLVNIVFMLALFVFAGANNEIHINDDMDPFSMEIHRPTRKSHNIVGDSQNVEVHEWHCPAPDDDNNMALVFYKRLVHMLINTIKLDHRDSIFTGNLYLTLSKDDLQTLEAFVNEPMKQSEDGVAKFHEVDAIFSKIYRKPNLIQIMESIYSWFDMFYMFLFNTHTIFVFVFGTMLYVVYKLMRANLSLVSIWQHLLFLCWIVDFAFRWMNQLQIVKIHRYADTLKYSNNEIPAECDPSRMGFGQKFMNLFATSDECRKYHELMFVNEIWTVNPFSVLSDQFDQVIKTPIISVGGAITSVIANMSAAFPWYSAVMLVPVTIISFLLLVCIAFSFVTRTSFKINLLHLIHLQFGQRQSAVGEILRETRQIIQELNGTDAAPTTDGTNTPQISPMKGKKLKAVAATTKEAKSDTETGTTKTEVQEVKLPLKTATSDNASSPTLSLKADEESEPSQLPASLG